MDSFKRILIRYFLTLSLCFFSFISLTYANNQSIQDLNKLGEFEQSFNLKNDLNYCQSKHAQCGKLIKDDGSGIAQCKPCSSGESCVSNRCEPICQSNQFGEPSDNLLVHMPLIINNDDLTRSDNKIKVTAPTYANFRSITDFTDKKIKILLKNTKHLETTTWSFKVIPTEENTYNTIIKSKNIDIQDVNGDLVVNLVSKNSNTYVLRAESAKLKTHSCNHIAIIFDKNQITLFVNGIKYIKTSKENDAFYTESKKIRIGTFPGKIWSFRVYARSLSDNEVTQLATKCLNSPSQIPYQEGYPNFLCGAYVCLWWPNDADLEQGEASIPLSTYQYYLKKQDEVYERFVLNSGMYPHRDICGYMNWSDGQGGRNLVLSYGIRKTFVKNFSESRPVNQFWLHENFHSFQGNLKGYSGKRGNKFLLESSASWGPDSIIAGTKEAHDTLLGMYTLVPHLPLWTDQSSPIQEGIYSHFKGGHQYGAFIFFAYVSRYILNNRFMGDIFNDSRASSQPIAAVNDILSESGHDLKHVFADFAAKTIHYDYLYTDTYQNSEIGSCKRMLQTQQDPNLKPETCIQDSPKIAAYLDEQGTNGAWIEVPSEFKVGSWAYNVYEINSPNPYCFKIGVSIDTNNPNYTVFQARVIIHNLTNNIFEYRSFPSMLPGDERIMNITSSENSKIYLVVVSTPDKYTGFESYNYHYNIQNISNVAENDFHQSLSCIKQNYVDKDICNEEHLNDMYSTCKTDKHLGLNDGMFKDQVKKGLCNKQNWENLISKLEYRQTPPQSLEESVMCIKHYAYQSECNWQHWTEMYITCKTYKHTKLKSNDFLLNKVRNNECTKDNWENLNNEIYNH